MVKENEAYFEEDSESFEWPEGKCQGCDNIAEVDEFDLCEDCRAKLERDLIRQRAWAYSAIAYGLSAKDCEEMRKQVITQYGKAYELIVE
jgi:hypothetical protein